ncbi:hypothetical protein H072_3098 [Dactylellina haptotyla CBS 200.50]|uniref:Uncharacterized protein n=1 Tax=Dactylellina haptotyla (strain CBS 200.50) TaxID=1284197 RepID=S8C5G3_DACHA|nr:hypothetical protein H072_3098 [Dactylellina haptotyla CBS 200.50]
MKFSSVAILALAAAVTASPIVAPVENGELVKRDCPVGTTAYTNCARACYYRYSAQSPCAPGICQLIADSATSAGGYEI